jgi:hypothetical protein
MTATLQSQSSDLSHVDWAFVKNLLHDLQAEENREEIASLFGQWRLSIKAFRRVEERRMIRSSPEPLDILCHKVCVTNLMSFGAMLQVAATDHGDDELAKHGLRRDVIEALVQDLHNTLDEWHGQVSSSRIAELEKQIFNAPTAPDRRDTRAEV